MKDPAFFEPNCLAHKTKRLGGVGFAIKRAIRLEILLLVRIIVAQSGDASEFYVS